MSPVGRDDSADADRGGETARPRPVPGPTTLLALYPAAWRRRYGDELDALILDMHADGRETGWRVRADVLRSAARERLHGRRGGDPSPRIRGGAALVLWAWALFVVAGAIVAKTSEHWRSALPGHPHSPANAAFGGLTAVAIAAAVLVAAGVALTLPGAARSLRDGGWRPIRARALIAVTLTIVAVPATIALVAWAHRLTVVDRNGHDGPYAAAFLCWAALGAACLLAWTSVATRLASGLRCGRAVLRAQALIAPVVAIAMAAMTVAAAAWWAIVGHDDPAALTGGSAAAHPSAVVPQLVIAVALMLAATVIAVVGAVRADVALAEL